MTEDRLTKIIERIMTTRSVSREEAESFYEKLIEDTKFHIKLCTYDLSEEEISERAEVTIENQLFPPMDDEESKGKRWQVKRGCLVYMLQERAAGRTSVHPAPTARFLHDAGIRQTKSGKPDPKSVGDALGVDGLQLKKQSDGSYPIPSKSQHFITDKSRNVVPPPEGDCSLDALCRKYNIESPLVKNGEVTSGNN